MDELTEVVLSGSARDGDGSIRTYRWTQVSGPDVEVADADTAQARFDAPDGVSGTAELVFRLTVTDDMGATASDEVTVTVTYQNSPPTVNAGIDQDVAERARVELSGSAEDSDGTIQSHLWTQVSGPGVEIADADAAQAWFDAPDRAGGTVELVFRLTVTDDLSATASDEVVITVSFANNPPVAVPPKVHFRFLANSDVGVIPHFEDSDGTIVSYEWTQVGGPPLEVRTHPDGALNFVTTSQPPEGFGDLVEYLFLCTATDDLGATATQEFTFTVNYFYATYNSLPIANAGADRSVGEGVTVTLAGEAEDSDGTIESAQWTQVAGPQVELLDAHGLVASFTAPEVPSGAADLVFRLTVMDDSGATAIDEVVVSVVSNSPPSADAGPDRTVEERTTVTLSGQADDPDGTISSSRWAQLSGPPVELVDSDALVATFTAPDISSGADTLAFRLTATDNRGASATDDVSIIVKAQGAIRISGRVTFDYVPVVKSEGLQYLATEARAVHGVTVQLRDNVEDRLLDAAVTDHNGDYAVYAMPDTKVFVRVRAEILDESGAWDVRVVNSDHATPVCGMDDDYALYAMDSAPFDAPDTAVTRDFHAASGWTGDGYGEARVAAPFAILDVIFDAMQYVRSSVGGVEFRPLLVSWGTQSTGASHSSCEDMSVIRLGGAENEDTDEYDRTVIAHEWGHYFQVSFSRNDTLRGPHNPLFDHLEMATAFSEGFASALGAAVTNDPTYTSTFGPQQGRTAGFSLESVFVQVRGWFNESSVAQIVYDLIDPVNDDTLELGFRPVFDVLVDEFRHTRSITSIFSFIHALKNRVPEYAAAIDAIVGFHRIQPVVDEWGSTETNSGGRAVAEVLPVYPQLVVNGGPVNGCSVDTYGRLNKLGIHRYFRFQAESPGDYTVSATLTSSPPGIPVTPVLWLRTGGAFGDGGSKQCSASELENCVHSLELQDVSAGDNVLVLWDEGNFQPADPNRGRKCFDVEITSR